jgi:vacuolar-type H+-ATPase subunit H
MSTTEQLQEIIVDSSIRSFNQGYRAGIAEARNKIAEIIRENTVSAKSMTDGYVIEGITLTPTELIKIVEEMR